MPRIKVALRVRPLSSRERLAAFPVVVGVSENAAFITDIKVPERQSADSRKRFREFDFNHAFWLTDEAKEAAGQDEVYLEMGPSLEESILEGYNACLLAYGQSGTGKTHTMLGTKMDPGLIPRLCQGLWKKFKAHCCTGDKSFRMEVSFMEIYREKVRDLFAPSEKPLKLREHPQLGPHVQGLKRIEIEEGLNILDLLWSGERRRAIGATGSNHHSSRSHAIWTLYLTSTRRGGDGSELVTRNQVHLVDLAGSEKADLITTKHLLAEGKDINRSLVSLGNVISSLAEKAQYIPYRDSALTWLLKDSLGGNATTAIIITASPASCCHAQTLNSFRFAQRARMVENQPKINVTKFGGRHKKSSSIFSGVSAFDLKNDIARLVSIIRSAQGNGGLLRGFSPSNGWNRLISAIENWSHEESGQEKFDARQNPARTSVEAPSSTTNNRRSKSSSHDLDEAQVDCKASGVKRVVREPIVKGSRNKVPGTEVFIPMSNSFKCLTWRQQEVQQASKPLQFENEVFATPPSTPQGNIKVLQTKYLFPVHFPTTRNVEPDARICERIHGTIENLTEPIQLLPIEVKNRLEQSPVIRGKQATLVNPMLIRYPFKESRHTFNGIWDENRNFLKPVHCKGNETSFSFNIPNASEFTTKTRVQVPVLQSADEDEEEMSCWKPSYLSSNFRAVRSHKVMTPKLDDTGFDPGHSFNDSILSSSSYESLDIPRIPAQKPVKVVENCDFDFTEIESHFEPLSSLCQHHLASVSCIEDPAGDRSSNYTRASSSVSKSNHTADSSSKFKRFFGVELEELESIGKQIRTLKQKTERYSRIQPFLSQIENLKLQDHSKADEKVDAEIEQCSGWSVAIEFQKVQNEMATINKLLQGGVPPKSRSNSSLSNSESNYSSSAESCPSSKAKCSSYNASGSFPAWIPSKCKPIPTYTSTPRKEISSSWAELHRKNGPGGDTLLDRNDDFKRLHMQAEQRIRQRWKPFLPKTHSYLCQQKGSPVTNRPHGRVTMPQTCEATGCVQDCPNFQCLRNPYLLRHQRKHVLPFNNRQRPLHSLSSEESSQNDGSFSDHFISSDIIESTEFCPHQDSLDSFGYCDPSLETDFPSQYFHDSPYQNGLFGKVYNFNHDEHNYSSSCRHKIGVGK